MEPMMKQLTYPLLAAVLGAGLMLSPISAMPAFAESDAIHTSWRNNKAVEGLSLIHI